MQTQLQETERKGAVRKNTTRSR